MVPRGVGHLWPQCLAPCRVGAFRGPGAIDPVPGQWPGSRAWDMSTGKVCMWILIGLVVAAGMEETEGKDAEIAEQRGLK